MTGLLCDEEIKTNILSRSIQYRNVMDRQKDRIPISISRVSIAVMTRDKNSYKSIHNVLSKTASQTAHHRLEVIRTNCTNYVLMILFELRTLAFALSVYGTVSLLLIVLISPPLLPLNALSHIVESCPLTKLNGGLSRLHSADEDAVSWLTNYG